MVMTQGRRLNAEDWSAAALSALGEKGLAGIAVEPLAARLRTTKGSFYWHFANRDALIAAALDLWERSHTEAIIAAVDRERDPALRLRSLFRSILSTSATRGGNIEVNLLAVADHPLVAPVMARVVERFHYFEQGVCIVSTSPNMAGRSTVPIRKRSAPSRGARS
jgi:AcrR family transcriptional regulator